MKKQSLFVEKFLKQYQQICPGIVDSWYAPAVQEKFNSFKSKKCCTHECVSSSSAQKCTCFILFCVDRRKELQLQHPHVPNKQITSMLAKEWQAHKQIAQENPTSNDNVYKNYKNRYEKMVFFDKHKDVVKNSYPELSDQELELALEKLYTKYTNQK